MGVLNVTPDSFSDGGLFNTVESAVAQAEKLISQGVDILDIGGESTRPFADSVSVEDELLRVIPVIQAIRERHSTPISIDTTKALVAQKALEAGANYINDISALRLDPEMISVVKTSSVPVIIMHMQGSPADMQIKPTYENILQEMVTFFNERIAWLVSHGVAKNRIIIDPGIGFGKTISHNLTLLKNLETFSQFGVPLLLAHSRKRFLGEITGVVDEKNRDLATAVVSALCVSKKIAMVRVHDVASTRQALEVAAALERGF
ncbi:dihydropteroate synthase [Desulforhopalus sp. IMCC35007]|uniref:dihydropteroate synthase n=1 Tax=Desulforhopalus sp. IMCC35007 TaxID=2569543 RepID=UPI001F0D69D0|nr:dihydropteroate synthase [Desulforhopalus sp. IMCC35007]